MITDPLKLLLVDDTSENLVALEALLRRPDVELVTAHSGAEALEHCLAHEISLALVDVQMPGMDGFELAELMRGTERTKHVPIIFITAGAHDQQRLFKGYETGAVDFLFKPIDPHILTSKVNVLLELARQRRELAQALQINELFVGILGHDLRNPLAAMSAGLDLLSERLRGDAQLTRVLDRMRSSTERMRMMVTELLDLTYVRLAPGLGLARARDPLDLRELVVRTIDELRIAHGRDVSLEGPPVAAFGDPERLLQLFSNLIGNAIMHGQPDTPIAVHLSRRDNTAIIEVHNYGVIPRELLSTLFEPFRRGRPRNREGLGLGLFIAREIARAHGGDITVRSSEEEGTVFTVRLQCADVPVSERRAEAGSERSGEAHV